MEKQSFIIMIIGLLVAILIVSSGFKQHQTEQSNMRLFAANELKKEALEILEAKCNVCHKKRNPLMVFREKNMSKRAEKIYQMVFVEKRMPKGDRIRLTPEESGKLKEWLQTEIN